MYQKLSKKLFFTKLLVAILLCTGVSCELNAGSESADENASVVPVAAAQPPAYAFPAPELAIADRTKTFLCSPYDVERDFSSNPQNMGNGVFSVFFLTDGSAESCAPTVQALGNETTATALRIDETNTAVGLPRTGNPPNVEVLQLGDDEDFTFTINPTILQSITQNIGCFSNLSTLVLRDICSEYDATPTGLFTALQNVRTLQQFRCTGVAQCLDDRAEENLEALETFFTNNDDLELVVIKVAHVARLSPEAPPLERKHTSYHRLARALGCLLNVRFLGVHECHFSSEDLGHFPTNRLEHLSLDRREWYTPSDKLSNVQALINAENLKKLYLRAAYFTPQSIAESAEVFSRLSYLFLTDIHLTEEICDALCALENPPEKLFVIAGYCATEVRQRMFNRFGVCGTLTPELYSAVHGWRGYKCPLVFDAF